MLLLETLSQPGALAFPGRLELPKSFQQNPVLFNFADNQSPLLDVTRECE